MIEFWRYDRWDSYIGPLSDVMAASSREESGGENSVTLTTSGESLAKGDRVVWRDSMGKWHEHIANEPVATRGEDGSVVYETYCEDAINELFRDKVDEIRVRSGTADAALDKILQQTRWKRGKVDVTGSRTKSFYHISVGEAIQQLVKTWGGEVYSSFDVDENGIVSRMVNLVTAMGDRATHKRFEYGKDLVSVKRTVEADDVYTAMRGFGKGDDLGDDDEGTNGRRITFADLNGGRDYVEDREALERWGRPDGKGGKAHAFGTVTFQDCEDPAELMELTRDALDKAKRPKVSYECSVRDLAAMGCPWEGVGVGDSVQVVDTCFSPALRLEARVMAIRRNLFDPADTDVSIGNVRSTISDELSGIVSQIAGIGQQSSSWDAAVNLSPNYLNRVIATLNAGFDAGGAYKYESFEQGVIVSSVPLDEQMRPKRTPATAIQLKGGGFRIASGVRSDGSFDWRTFGTGAGFTADCITAGEIRGGSNRWNLETGDLMFEQGGIRDSKGRNYWNLDTGEFKLSSSGTTIDGKRPATADKAIKSVDVEYASGASQTTAPTSGWSTTAPAWEAGRYIWQRTKTTAQDGTATYSAPTCIQGAEGTPGADGKPGDDGAQGVGVSRIAEQYYLSTSSYSQSGGSWSTEQPAWSKGRYIWTRSEVTWTDGRTTYTSPVLAKAVNGANQSASDAKDSVARLDSSLTQREIFNRLTNNGQTQGIYLTGGRIYINGEYIKAGTISTDRIESARNSSLYVHTGTTVRGNPGTSFVDSSGDYMSVEALRAVDDPTNRTTGTGLAIYDKGFLDCSTYYEQLWLNPPMHTGYMSKPAEQLYMRCSSRGDATKAYVELQRNDNQGVFFGNGYTELRFDRAHYVRIDSGGVQCRCGSKGFGWLDGKFCSDLVWS